MKLNMPGVVGIPIVCISVVLEMKWNISMSQSQGRYEAKTKLTGDKDYFLKIVLKQRSPLDGLELPRNKVLVNVHKFWRPASACSRARISYTFRLLPDTDFGKVCKSKVATKPG